MRSAIEKPKNLSLMPAEILLMIASELPPSARALLALACKGFFDILTPLAARLRKQDQRTSDSECPQSSPQTFRSQR